MGLDMYLNKVRKLTKEEENKLRKIKSFEELDAFDEPYYYIVLDSGEEKRITRDLARYGTIISLPVAYIDIGKIRKEFDIDEDTDCTGRCYDAKYTAFWFDGDEIKISNEILEKKYLTEIERDVLVYRNEGELFYWRKDWDMHDYICEITEKEIENTERVYISEENLKKIAERDPRVHDAVTNDWDMEDPGISVFYYPWW